jgi:enoyl-CoA hydratase
LQDAVTLVRFNRPQALNALNSQVPADLIAAFAVYDADPAQRCLVLTGSEKAFAAGAYIKGMQPKGFSAMFAENFFAGFEKVVATRNPWIAAVSGFALGGGCELAMMADFIIAADTARFGQPEIKLGVAPGMGGSQRLTRAVGKAKSMQMCLTGRMMDAAEAERASLVAQVVPATELLDEALKRAKLSTEMPPLAAIANKEMVNAFSRRTFRAVFCLSGGCSTGSALRRISRKACPPLLKNAKVIGAANKPAKLSAGIGRYFCAIENTFH